MRLTDNAGPFTYGSETICKKKSFKRIQTADMKYLRGAAGYKHADHQYNTETTEKLNFVQIQNYRFSKGWKFIKY
jgi:hypothetical protein